MTASDRLDEIVSRMTEIERNATPPEGAPEIRAVYDELTANPSSFPCVVNVPRRMVRVLSTNGQRRFTADIDIYFLFGSGDYGYATRAQRQWIGAMVDAFDDVSKLGSDGVDAASLDEINFDPVEINNIPHVAITMTLRVVLTEPYTFGA